MTLQTPTTQDINDNIIAQLEASLNQTIPLLPKSFLRVLAKVIAGVFVILYKYGGFIFLQIFVKTAINADTDINGKIVNPLVEWGRLIGIGDPAPATNAELLIDVTVTNQIGFLPSNSQLTNSNNGVTYLTLGSVALNAPVVQVTIKAVSDQGGGNGAGSIGNLETGDIVSFANPLPNVNRNATVVSQSVTGADGEATEAYRQRIIDRFQKRPQGGAYADYELWGEEPVGIINIYPYTGSPGEVDVYAEATEASSGSPDGFPTQAQLDEVKASIELDENGLATRRPANAFVNVFSITRKAFTVQVLNLTVDDQGEVQSQIEDAITEYFLDAEPFIVGVSVLPRRDRISRAELSGIVSGIVSASGGFFTRVDIYDGATLVDIYFLGIGEKSKVTQIDFL